MTMLSMKKTNQPINLHDELDSLAEILTSTLQQTRNTTSIDVCYTCQAPIISTDEGCTARGNNYHVKCLQYCEEYRGSLKRNGGRGERNGGRIDKNGEKGERNGERLKQNDRRVQQNGQSGENAKLNGGIAKQNGGGGQNAGRFQRNGIDPRSGTVEQNGDMVKKNDGGIQVEPHTVTLTRPSDSSLPDDDGN